MARPLRIAYPGAFYHVTSRGNEQKDVFKSRKDREKFLEYLASATQRYGALIHAYCLMSNHYHLLLETPAGNLSQIMQHINSAYTTYFNIKRKRAGHLFQGRYKAILVEADEYATELSRYIHLNPVRAGIVSNPEDYPWSSYRSYIGEGNVTEWLKREFILGYFGKRTADAMKKYRKFVEDMLGEEYESPLKNTFGTAILGTAGFIETITATHLSTKEVERDVPALRQFASNPSLEEIRTAVNTQIVGDEKLARQAGMYLCHRYSGEKLRTIGELYNVRESAITEASRLFPRKMEKDKNLHGVMDRIKGALKI
jgi:REP element-mobilizing transposase RayT